MWNFRNKWRQWQLLMATFATALSAACAGSPTMPTLDADRATATLTVRIVSMQTGAPVRHTLTTLLSVTGHSTAYTDGNGVVKFRAPVGESLRLIVHGYERDAAMTLAGDFELQITV